MTFGILCPIASADPFCFVGVAAVLASANHPSAALGVRRKPRRASRPFTSFATGRGYSSVLRLQKARLAELVDRAASSSMFMLLLVLGTRRRLGGCGLCCDDKREEDSKGPYRPQYVGGMNTAEWLSAHRIVADVPWGCRHSSRSSGIFCERRAKVFI